MGCRFRSVHCQSVYNGNLGQLDGLVSEKSVGFVWLVVNDFAETAYVRSNGGNPIRLVAQSSPRLEIWPP